MSATHNQLVRVNQVLDPPPQPGFAFGRVALFRAGAAATFLPGDRFRDYASADEVSDDLALGELDAVSAEYALNMFAQSPPPAGVRIVRYDPAAVPTAETPAIAFDAMALLPGGDDWYAAHMVWSSSGGAALSLVTNLLARIVQRGYGFLVVDAPEASLASGALSASTMNITTNAARVAIVYNDNVAAEGHGNCQLARTLAFNPDIQTSAFKGPINAINGLVTPITAAQRSQLLTNNVNVVLPGFGTSHYFAKGQMLDGRKMSQVYIADWLKLRMEADLRALMLDYDTRGQIIPLSPVGIAIFESVLQARLDNAVSIGKINPGQYVIEGLTADVNTGEIEATIRAQNATEADGFKVTLFVTRNTVVVTTTT
jgi:hypothetical protein